MTEPSVPALSRLPDMAEAARPHARCLLPEDGTQPPPSSGPVPALRAAVVYSSVTGNTRRVAEALTLEDLPLFSVNSPNLSTSLSTINSINSCL